MKKITATIDARGTMVVLIAMVAFALYIGGATAIAQDSTVTPDVNVTITPDLNDTGDADVNDADYNPIWLIIKNATETHAEELKERIFEYRINNTANASEQAQIIRERNIELHNATRLAQTQTQAIVLAKQSGEISQEDFVAAIHLIHTKTQTNANNADGLKHVVEQVDEEVLDEAGVTESDVNDLASTANDVNDNAKKIKDENTHGQGHGNNAGDGESDGDEAGQGQGQGQGNQGQGNQGQGQGKKEK